jgi:phage tail-like protein
MDANGTRFHLLLGHDDWARCKNASVNPHKLSDSSPPQSAAVAWNDQRNELTLEPRLFKFTAAPRDTFPSVENRRGAGRDAFGNWYWIDETGRRLRVLSSGSGVTSDFWPVKEGCQGSEEFGGFHPRHTSSGNQPLPLAGLAVTEDHYLVVGVSAPAGLLIFDLSAGGGPRQLLWPSNVLFAPFDMAPRPGGGVWILDRQNHCYWALDRHFNVIGTEAGDTLLAAAQLDDFQPLDDQSTPHGSQRRTFPTSLSLLQSPLALIDPIAIEALPDGTVLILDFDPTKRFSRIYRYSFTRQLDDEISTRVILKLIEPEHQLDFSLVAYDLAFVPEHSDENGQPVADRLYVVAADGNQSYAFRLCLRDQKIELQPLAEYLPMRLFGGKALVGGDTAAYYDFAETWIPLVKQNRPRYVPDATLETPNFDGREPDCVWHRLMLDACIPPETKVEVWSRAANEESSLATAQWQREPNLYLRPEGGELPFLRPIWSVNGNGSTNETRDGDGTWELLFQRASGRYLQLRLRLSGNERNTPRLRNLRIYYPRFSYLQNYLPAVYRDDDQSASFLDRYLANVEGMYTGLEDKIATVQALFDVRSAPTEVLDWLANWFGVALDPTWDEARRRMFIRHAIDFFQYRGTRRGLTIALHLALDACADETIFQTFTATGSRGNRATAQEIRIVEKYLTLTTPGVVFGDTSEATGPRVLTVGTKWEPSQGRENLNQRYASSIDAGERTSVLVQYPLIAPSDSARATLWAQFSQATVGFVPASAAAERTAWQAFLQGRYASIELLNGAHKTSYAAFNQLTLPNDSPKAESTLKDWQDFVLTNSPSATANTRHLWHDFLARRYRRIKAFNQVYGSTWTTFDLVSLPDQLPADGAPLTDWYQFEAVVLQMQRTAHRFSVLLPVPLSQRLSPDKQQERLALAQRIIDLEKPAHTVFEVKFYWAMFRIGEARLQLDTVIDQGSRAPQLLPRAVLDQAFVGESYLAPPALEDARDRYVLGRDSLGGTPN